MLVRTKHEKEVYIRFLDNSDFDRLMHYLHNLSPETIQRFQPHSYHPEEVINFYQQQGTEACIAVDIETDQIVGYAVLKRGLLHHDAPRLQQYNVHIHHEAAYTFAPSVKDDWQSTGVGQSILNYVRGEMTNRNVRQLILWGGVQSENNKAVNFYRKNGFRRLGHFEYNGLNEDMLLDLH